MTASRGERPERDTSIAAQAIASVARTLHRGERVDMNRMAAELGIGRATLYRHVGDRQQLLGAALWRLADRGLAYVEKANEHLTGAEKIRAVAAGFMAAVARHEGVRRQLDTEPEATISALTSPQGEVQPRMIARVEQMLRDQVSNNQLRPLVSEDSLAYAIVRISESFLYADVLGNREPDLQAAEALIAALLPDLEPAPGRSRRPPAR